MAGSVGSDDGDAGFQIAPMVDVVFVLMLFFMACAGAQQLEKGMKVPLPGKTAGSQVAAVIEISADGLVSMNNRIFAQPTDHQLSELRAWFANTIATFGDNDPVVLRPSPDARHARVMEVLDCAAAAKVKNLSFH